MANPREVGAESWAEALAPLERGAQWRRVDLHLHGPGEKNFTLPDGADIRTESGRASLAEQYIQHLVDQGIWLGALTHHSGIREDWYQLLAARARDKGITLLPGAELSFSQPKYDLHILAVFDRDVSPDKVNRFLASHDSMDRGAELLYADGTHRDITPDDRIERILLELRERFNALIIIPHPDEHNGLVKSYGTTKAAIFLREVRPDALEHCPQAVQVALRNSGKLSEAFWSCLSTVEFSDPRRLEEIGTKRNADGTARTTFLKLSATDVDALRLALHDPGTRLRLGAVPPCMHPRITGMVVEGSGFLGKTCIAWNSDLNVIMGSRGAGKSAVLETLRYALDLPAHSDQPYRDSLVRHALGSGGKVTLVLERPLGTSETGRYVVSRVLGDEEPRVVEAETGKVVPLAPYELLGPRGGPVVLGQREMFAVSQSEEYRLSLLDELIGEEARDSAADVRKAVEELQANARAILEVRQHLEKREEHRQRLRSIEHEIEVYEKHGAAEKLREARNLRSDEQLLRNAAAAVSKGRTDWDKLEESLLAPLATAQRGLLRGQSSQKAILHQAAGAVSQLMEALRTVFDSGSAAYKNCEAIFAQVNADWKAALLPLEVQINRIKQEAHTDVLDTDRLLKLTADRTGLMPLLEELDRMDARLTELADERQELLHKVSELRRKEHRLRSERAEAISTLLEKRVSLEVEFKGDKADYSERLTSLLKGARLHGTAIDALVQKATDGIQLAAAVKAGPQEVQDRFDLTPTMADRLVRRLTDHEARLFELETLIPPDSLKVYLKVEDKYRPLEKLSVGQRATAILLLLFALEGRVLVLDQPEEDLDNRFIYDDIVQILRDQKGLRDPRRRRQIIVATHNANIPVLGDAELVLALEDRQDRAHVISRASIDEGRTRRLVKDIMEGGEEAFRRRAEKYGGVPLT